MAFIVKNVDWNEEKHRLSRLRERVFVYEWRIPAEYEFDGHDTAAHHVLVVDDKDRDIATGRLTAEGEIGRIAVSPSHRRPKVYRKLLRALLDIARQQDMQAITVQCDLAGVEHYQQKGFSPVGSVYMDAGVPRQRMQCNIDRFDLNRIELTH